MKIRYLLPWVATAALLAGALLLPALHAQQTAPGTAMIPAGSFQRFGRFGAARRILWRLHLTEDQRKSGLAVLRGHRPAIKPLVDQLLSERAALRALTRATTVDEAAIRAQSARIACVEMELAVQRDYLMHDLRAVATPGQLQILDDMQARAETRRKETMQRIDDWIANS